MSDERYGIADLARLGGVTRRTVRFYVQEGLLPAPFGAGRGAHYGGEHLQRLLQVKSMQENGLSLEGVRARLSRPQPPATRVRHERHGYRREWTAALEHAALASHLPAGHGEEATAPPAVPRSAWVRLELVPGVEIHVSDGRRLPSPRRLAQLADWCRTHFGPERGIDPGPGSDGGGKKHGRTDLQQKGKGER